MTSECTLGDIRDLCIRRAKALLDADMTAPAAETAESVKSLVETAIAIEMLTLRQAEQNRFYAATARGRISAKSKQQIHMLAKEVRETHDIKEAAQLLQREEWIAVNAAISQEDVHFVLIRIS